MKRKIIIIDENKCNGCGACAAACHEGAIGMVNGKAKLLRDDYCDGLGDCLPACPTGAISFEVREAAAYNESAVKASKEDKVKTLFCDCPGIQSKTITPSACETKTVTVKNSCLMQRPFQIKLVPVKAPFFKNANLLIAADCTAYAYANFHEDFIKGHIAIIGCPKLDNVDYTEKLTEIIVNNDIKSVTVVKMDVPCCRGIELAATNALKRSEKFIPWRIITISTDGKILD